MYDATRMGLPQRMRDYAVRVQAGRQQAGRTTALNGLEHEAVETIAGVAGQPVPTLTESRDELRVILRSARANAHPDRNNGDRSTWDAVEDAAKVLRL